MNYQSDLNALLMLRAMDGDEIEHLQTVNGQHKENLRKAAQTDSAQLEQIGGLKTTIYHQKVEITSQLDEIASLKAQIAALRAAAEQSAKREYALNAEINSLGKENKQLHAQNAQQSKRVASLREAANHSARRESALEDENAALNDENAALKAEIATQSELINDLIAQSSHAGEDGRE